MLVPFLHGDNHPLAWSQTRLCLICRFKAPGKGPNPSAVVRYINSRTVTMGLQIVQAKRAEDKLGNAPRTNVHGCNADPLSGGNSCER